MHSVVVIFSAACVFRVPCGAPNRVMEPLDVAAAGDRFLLTGKLELVIVASAMGSCLLQHQVWFAYYFSPPALLAGRWVLKC